MAYSTADIFNCLTPSAFATGVRIFYHESANDGSASAGSAAAAGFITDGFAKGLRVGDFVIHVNNTGTTGSNYPVGSQTTTATTKKQDVIGTGLATVHRVLTISEVAATFGSTNLTAGTAFCAGA